MTGKDTLHKLSMQTVQGQLCAELYRELGEVVLPVISRVYGDYGYKVGMGLKQKWKPENLEQAMTAFIKMTNAAGYPSGVHMEGETAHWTGHKCPFGLENTCREVCDAMMDMDRELLRALVGVERDRIELTIEKTLAGGDDCCQGTVRLRRG